MNFFYKESYLKKTPFFEVVCVWGGGGGGGGGGEGARVSDFFTKNPNHK